MWASHNTSVNHCSVLVQVKIVKADIPENFLEKVMLRTNEAMDKYQIEKVGHIFHLATAWRELCV